MRKTATLVVEFEWVAQDDLRAFEKRIGAYFDSLDLDASHIEVAEGDMETSFGIKKP